MYGRPLYFAPVLSFSKAAVLGCYGTKIDQTLPLVRTRARFKHIRPIFGKHFPPKTWAEQLFIFGGFTTTSQLNSEYLRTKQVVARCYGSGATSEY